MADYGLRVRNDNTFQIDSNYRNYHLVQKGSINLSQVGNNGMTFFGDITLYNKIQPILAFRSPRNGAYSVQANQGNGQFLYRFVKARNPNTDYNNLIEYYIFDLIPGNGSTGTWGMKIRNQANEIAYDFGGKPMRIIDFIRDVVPPSSPNPQPGGSVGGQDYNYGSGRLYAAIDCRHGQYSNSIYVGTNIPDRIDYTTDHMLITKDDGVTLANILTYYDSGRGDRPYLGGGSPYSVSNGDWLIVDVTNY